MVSITNLMARERRTMCYYYRLWRLFMIPGTRERSRLSAKMKNFADVAHIIKTEWIYSWLCFYVEHNWMTQKYNPYAGLKLRHMTAMHVWIRIFQSICWWDNMELLYVWEKCNFLDNPIISHLKWVPIYIGHREIVLWASNGSRIPSTILQLCFKFWIDWQIGY